MPLKTLHSAGAPFGILSAITRPRPTGSPQHMNRTRSLAAAIGIVALVIAGCSSSTTQGLAVSPLYDAFRAGGLPAEDGPSGIKGNAPAPEGDVSNTDDGDIDRLSLLAINDIVEFWEKNYSESLEGKFTPIDKLVSYDSDDPSSPKVCGRPTYQLQNAFYCYGRDTMAWDRGELVPAGKKYFGEPAVAALFAHEYGHAIQNMAGLRDDDTPSIVKEQQADCFAGTLHPLDGGGSVAALQPKHRRRTQSRSRSGHYAARPHLWRRRGRADGRPGARQRARSHQCLPDRLHLRSAPSAPRSTVPRSRSAEATCRRPCRRTRPGRCRAATSPSTRTSCSS